MSQGARPIAIVGVSVIDPATRSVDADRTVITRSGEIVDVGATDGSAPADAEVSMHAAAT